MTRIARLVLLLAVAPSLAAGSDLRGSHVDEAKPGARHAALQTEGSRKPSDSDCHYIMGLSKVSWAFVCNLLALVVILLCIPLLLSCSKRRPLGASMFEFGKCGPENASYKGGFYF
eukprot:CAMPEP_0181470934 /NCGR_PEP_ID=MMETSP1110-20121109/38814_1 /TAXON_ID=174948 /ORGANISM="Symbiodinium sp., Strain CCMP421" /LENGTH=115 /DNA_ID=CAMNT_0023595935 /DNA_START=30 /DNA_END=377 /DNA_ORIENTATION=+